MNIFEIEDRLKEQRPRRFRRHHPTHIFDPALDGNAPHTHLELRGNGASGAFVFIVALGLLIWIIAAAAGFPQN